MSFLSSIPIIGKLFGDTADIVKEVVVDKDAQNRILKSLDVLRMQSEKELYIAGLNTQTIPWVDALHKMGRQILNAMTLIVVLILLLNDIDITGPAATVIGGGNAVYQFVKGKGNAK